MLSALSKSPPLLPDLPQPPRIPALTKRPRRRRPLVLVATFSAQSRFEQRRVRAARRAARSIESETKAKRRWSKESKVAWRGR